MGVYHRRYRSRQRLGITADSYRAYEFSLFPARITNECFAAPNSKTLTSFFAAPLGPPVAVECCLSLSFPYGMLGPHSDYPILRHGDIARLASHFDSAERQHCADS